SRPHAHRGHRPSNHPRRCGCRIGDRLVRPEMQSLRSSPMRRITICLFAASMMACGAEVGATVDGGVDAAIVLDADLPPSDAGSGDAGPQPTEDAEVSDASEPPLCLTFDPPDERGLDEDCDGAEGTRESSIYVSN